MSMNEGRMVYLDNAATTRPSAEAIENFCMVSADHWGNPSSTAYTFGQDAQTYLNKARKTIAKCIGAKPKQIFFTSGSTEGANTIIQGQIPRGHEKDWCIVTTGIEHPCVYNTAMYMQSCGVDVYMLNDPIVSMKELTKLIADISDRYKHVLVCVMDVNNETGHCEPTASIAKVTGEYPNVYLFTDMTQSIAHAKCIDVKELGMDYAIASAHKFGGLKGVGFIYVKNPVLFRPFMYGGHQENGKRPGTENVAGIYSMAMQLKHVRDCADQTREEMDGMMHVLMDGLAPHISRSYLEAPNIVSLTLTDVDANQLITLLDLHNIEVSAGSACSTGDNKPSRVLKTLGYTDDEARSTIRVSLNEDTTINDINSIIADIDKNIVWTRKDM